MPSFFAVTDRGEQRGENRRLITARPHFGHEEGFARIHSSWISAFPGPTIQNLSDQALKHIRPIGMLAPLRRFTVGAQRDDLERPPARGIPRRARVASSSPRPAAQRNASGTSV